MKERMRWAVALIVIAVACYAAGVLAGASKPYPRWTLTDYQEIPFGPVCQPGQPCQGLQQLRVGIIHDYLTGAQVVVIPGVGLTVIGYDKGPAAESR